MPGPAITSFVDLLAEPEVLADFANQLREAMAPADEDMLPSLPAILSEATVTGTIHARATDILHAFADTSMYRYALPLAARQLAERAKQAEAWPHFVPLVAQKWLTQLERYQASATNLSDPIHVEALTTCKKSQAALQCALRQEMEQYATDPTMDFSNAQTVLLSRTNGLLAANLSYN